MMRMVSAKPRDEAMETNSSLIRRVAAKDAQGWEEFYARYRPLVLSFALRCGLRPAEAEEAAQDVFVQVARLLPGFDPNRERGSFRSWLLGQTRWRVADKFRERRGPLAPESETDCSTGTDPVHRIPSESEFEAIWSQEWEQALLAEALREMRARVSPRDYQVFDLLHRQGLPPEAVANQLGLNRRHVALIKHRVKEQLRTEVERVRTTWDL